MKKKKKQKPRGLIVKERAKWAREHYYRHFGGDERNNDDNSKWTVPDSRDNIFTDTQTPMITRTEQLLIHVLTDPQIAMITF